MLGRLMVPIGTRCALHHPVYVRERGPLPRREVFEPSRSATPENLREDHRSEDLCSLAFLPIVRAGVIGVEQRSNYLAVIFFALGVLIGALSVLFIARNNAVAHGQLVSNRCRAQACQTGALPFW